VGEDAEISVDQHGFVWIDLSQNSSSATGDLS